MRAKALANPNVILVQVQPDCVAIPANIAASGSFGGGNDYFAVGTFGYANTDRQLKTAIWNMCVFPREEAIPYEHGNHFVPDWDAELASYSLYINYDGGERL